MASIASCFALSLTLGQLLLPVGNIPIGPPSLATSIANVSVGTAAAANSLTFFNFSSTGADLLFPMGNNLQLQADLVDPIGVVGLVMNISIAAGSVAFVNTVREGTCLIENVTVAHCGLHGDVTAALTLKSGGLPAWIESQWLQQQIDKVSSWINDDTTCGGWAEFIASVVVSLPDDAPLTLPPVPSFPEMCDLRNSPLMRMAETVVNHLPTLFGVRFGLVVPTANAVRVAVLSPAGTGGGPVTLFPGTDDWINIPANTGISMDLVFDKVMCPAGNSVEILDNVSVMNIRLTNGKGSSVARLVDDLGPALAAKVTTLLRSVSRSLPANDTSILLTIPTHEGKTAPFYTMALVTSASLIVGLVALGIAVRRHRGKLLLDQHGNPVSRLALFVGDAILIVGCCVTIVCFAWSNQTGAATVRLGGTFDLYNFGLADSVRDMWSAGLYALSFFIALFCGFYPYFKLLSILLFSVVLQRPQSKMLHFIDLCGKFSLLDSFVMIILAEGLTVPGIVAVEMGPSFWVFLGATVSSMALGNYATHGWRSEVDLGDAVNLQLESTPALGRDRTPRVVTYRGAYIEDMSPSSPVRRASSAISISGAGVGPGGDREADPNRFRPIVAGLAFVAMFVLLGIPTLFDAIEFKNSGVGSLVTGTTIRYTLVELILKSPTGLVVTAFVSVFIMPLLFAAGYKWSRALAAWCAPDAFLLACVAALFQLNQFVVFVLGSAFKGVITINAELLWPVYTLGGAVVLLWFLIVGLFF